ncbi:hat1 interacting factor [Saccharomyces pastorianus]|uniref:Hat1 interacting factor n=1 Tax=Saccharomyces pastorianus TaxID=27292 RepID=A0A6C1ECL2_SACPS|nr:hat1 interacting factor [Saccharomyces pastorianus]
MDTQIQRAKDLLAQKKYAEAAKRCQRSLDTLSQGASLPDPELIIIFAQAVYNMEVQNSGNLFGDALTAAGDGSGSESESDVSQEDDEGEDGQADMPNSRMFQFDQEEEDLTGGVEGGESDKSGDEDTEEEDEEGVIEEGEQSVLQVLDDFNPLKEQDEEIEDLSQLRKSGFDVYFENDLYENALDLLAQALILLGHSSLDGPPPTDKTKSRIGDVYLLMGDTEREAEMFSRAIRHYMKALGYYKTLQDAVEVSDKTIEAEFLVCDALRWEHRIPTEDKLKRFKHVEALLQNYIASGPKDAQLQQARLAQIQDDIDEAQDQQQQHGPKRPFSQPTTSIGFPALDKPLDGFNDLSQLVKKKPRRH